MKKADYLVEYAKGQVGRPYWMGTWGQIADAALLAMNRTRLPAGYPTPGNPDFTTQYGQKVHDCNGLVYAASVCATPDSAPARYPNPYYPVNVLYEHCSEKGPVELCTYIAKGELLFNKSLGHVGIYGGDGYVYHAVGHAYGVIKAAYRPSDWAYHGKFTEMYQYNDEGKKIEIMEPPTIRTGCTGPAVKDWQALLISAGYKLPRYGIDGDFGEETAKATRALQLEYDLVQDAIVGPATWKERLNRL